MGDLYCKKCGEPFDEYGLHHGDMLAWQTDAFLKGLGCPCCLGIEKAHRRTMMQDLEMMDAAIDHSAPALMPDAEKPKESWEEPPPMELAVCSLCECKITVPQEEIFYKARGKKEFPEFYKPIYVNDKPYCKECDEKLVTCDECGKQFEPDDTIFFQDLMEAFCEGCAETAVSTCHCCQQSVKSENQQKGPDENYYCESCFDDKFKKCEKCEKVLEKHELNEDDLCSECEAKEP